MSSKRTGRIAEEIKKIVSALISKELKDPSIADFTSITEVHVTRDLRYAKLYISVLGTEKEKKQTIKGLQRASGFIRKEIGNNINLRYTPEPIFELDSSIEHGIHISKLIDKVKDNNGSEEDVRKF